MKTMIETPVNIGLDEKERRELLAGLSKLLADTYTLYLKTQNFHWNVIGPLFGQLHGMFEKQYRQLAEAADLIAERIRALGFFAPASYTEFAHLTSIKESSHDLIAEDMIRALLEDHESIILTAREVFSVAERTGDQATANHLAERMEEHEKTAWMLRSMLG